MWAGAGVSPVPPKPRLQSLSSCISGKSAPIPPTRANLQQSLTLEYLCFHVDANRDIWPSVVNAMGAM